MERYEINKYMQTFKQKIADLYEALQIKTKEAKLASLDALIGSPNFWDNQKEANNIINEANNIREDINLIKEIKNAYNNLEELDALQEIDNEAKELFDEEIINFKNKLDKAEEKALLSDKYDDNDAIVELHPGAGGTESMDWAQMLFRMYQRFALQQGFKFEILDIQPGDEAGLKSVTFQIKGKYAYGLMKSERGVHRLVRISPFDSGARRHTSFCSCDVAPLINDDLNIKIKDEDIRIDVYHSSGAGGQSVNTTDSAVRITHLPTNIVVTCQNERSQIKNKEVALKILKSKLLEREILAREEELNKIKGEQKGINFGSQIRSYVFCPYTLVKDHRTNFEVSNVQSVMDGDLINFMLSYLKMEKEKNE